VGKTVENIWGYEIIFPQDVLYSPELLWVKVEGGNLRLGISHLAVRAAKRLLAIEILSPKGTQLKKGDRIGSVENTKSRWEIKSPLSGEVLEVNPEMYGRKAANAIMKDAYGAGWLMDLKKVGETDSELQQLFRGGTAETKKWLKEQAKAMISLHDPEACEND
jgi:glycine cleavage system H protein